MNTNILFQQPLYQFIKNIVLNVVYIVLFEPFIAKHATIVFKNSITIVFGLVFALVNLTIGI